MAGPRVTEVSLSLAGSSRYAVAICISVLMNLLATQMDSRSPVQDRSLESYSIFKVHWHGDAFTHKKASVSRESRMITPKISKAASDFSEAALA